MAYGCLSVPQLDCGDARICGNPNEGKMTCAINREKVAPFGH